MKIVPKKGFLLLKPAAIETKTSGGILLAAKEETKMPSIGEIVEVGVGSEYKVGETVIVVLGASPYERSVELEGVKHLVISEESVVGYVYP